ncbi:hypothetical protein TcWFU_006645 [Taenia crassiceps]|uniref:Uncharacterized protein n=1 Tax=Taenia crassiceps TaxID=6207 RepID=A0ABR4Q3R3_9CEST
MGKRWLRVHSRQLCHRRDVCRRGASPASPVPPALSWCPSHGEDSSAWEAALNLSGRGGGGGHNLLRGANPPDEEVVPTTEAVVAAMHAVPPTDSTERWWREWNAQRLRKFASPSLLPPPSSLLPPLNSLISFRTTAPTHIELSEELGSQHFGRAPVAEECKVRDAEDEVEPSRPYADIPHSDARLPPNASSSQNLPRPPPSNQSFRAVDPTMPTLQLSHPSTFSAAIITPSPHSKRLRGPPQQLRPTPSHITPVLI